MSNWSAKNPYNSKITENYVLNGEGSRKETSPHLSLTWAIRALINKVGDALGVLPENPPKIVEELIEVQGWDRDQIVASHKGEKDLYSALKKDYEVHMANKKFVQSLTDKIVSSGMSISMNIVKRSRDNMDWSSTSEDDLPPGLNPSPF